MSEQFLLFIFIIYFFYRIIISRLGFWVFRKNVHQKFNPHQIKHVAKFRSHFLWIFDSYDQSFWLPIQHQPSDSAFSFGLQIQASARAFSFRQVSRIYFGFGYGVRKTGLGEVDQHCTLSVHMASCLYITVQLPGTSLASVDVSFRNLAQKFGTDTYILYIDT